jgi:hypothetical protein
LKLGVEKSRVEMSYNLEKSILEKKRTWTGKIWSFLTICFTILGIIFSIVDAIIKVIKVRLDMHESNLRYRISLISIPS